MENILITEAEELVTNLKKRTGSPVSTLSLFNPVR
jgi:hypothetical protein